MVLLPKCMQGCINHIHQCNASHMSQQKPHNASHYIMLYDVTVAVAAFMIAWIIIIANIISESRQ